MTTPAERFATATPTGLETKRPDPAPPTAAPLPPSSLSSQRVTRRVSVNGQVWVSYQRFTVGLVYAGELVEVDVHEDTLEVWLRGQLIKTVLRTSKGAVWIKRAQRR